MIASGEIVVCLQRLVSIAEHVLEQRTGAHWTVYAGMTAKTESVGFLRMRITIVVFVRLRMMSVLMDAAALLTAQARCVARMDAAAVVANVEISSPAMMDNVVALTMYAHRDAAPRELSVTTPMNAVYPTAKTDCVAPIAAAAVAVSAQILTRNAGDSGNITCAV